MYHRLVSTPGNARFVAARYEFIVHRSETKRKMRDSGRRDAFESRPILPATLQPFDREIALRRIIVIILQKFISPFRSGSEVEQIQQGLAPAKIMTAILWIKMGLTSVRF